MKEYFVYHNSFAAPFFSDNGQEYVTGNDPKEALEKFVNSYRHPAGLYFAALYASADAYHKDQKPLLTWTCNHELAKQKASKNKAGYSYLGKEPGKFEIDGKTISVENPKKGVFKEG